MKEYLVDYTELAKFIDALIAQKYPNEPTNKALREKSIGELDEAIGTAIFSRLKKPELDKLNRLLDRDSATEKDYTDFFKDTGLDLAEIVKKTAEDYATKFLSKGAQNA